MKNEDLTEPKNKKEKRRERLHRQDDKKFLEFRKENKDRFSKKRKYVENFFSEED